MHQRAVFMEYTAKMASGGMICIPSFMAIGCGIQVILRLQPPQFERLQCWYYCWEGFMKCAAMMASGGVIYI
jgi:hypothetical protein